MARNFPSIVLLLLLGATGGRAETAVPVLWYEEPAATWTQGKATQVVLQARCDGQYEIHAPQGQQLDGPQRVPLRVGQTYLVKFK